MNGRARTADTSGTRSFRAAATGVLRRYPATVVVTVLTLAVSIPALLSDDIVTALQQDPSLIGRGQWWRMITPMFVQGFGIGQFLFNLVGIMLVGVAVERRYGTVRWLILYLVAGIVSIAVTSWRFPDRIDSGSSAAVAGLIGAMVIAMLIRPELPPWPSRLYGVFFAVYLSCLAVAGPIAGAVGGTATIPVFALARRFVDPGVLRVAAAIVVMAATVALLVVIDVHGIGLLTGMIIAMPLTLLRIGKPVPESR